MGTFSRKDKSSYKLTMLSRYRTAKNHQWLQQFTVESMINNLGVIIFTLVLLFLFVWNFIKPKHFGLYQEHNKTQNCTSKACADKLKKYKILLRGGEIKLKNKNIEIQKSKENHILIEKVKQQVEELKESISQKDLQIKCQLEKINKIGLENNELRAKALQSKDIEKLSYETMSKDTKSSLVEKLEKYYDYILLLETKLESYITQECDLDKIEHKCRIAIEENKELKNQIETIQNDLHDSSEKFHEEIKCLTLTLQVTKSNLTKSSECNEKYIIEMAEMRNKVKSLTSENHLLQQNLRKKDEHFLAKEISNNANHKIAKEESIRLESELNKKREEIYEKERKLVRLENSIEETTKENNKLKFINENYAVENEQLEKQMRLLKETNEAQLNQILQLQGKNRARKVKINELQELVISHEVRSKAQTEAISRISRPDHPHLFLGNDAPNRTRIMNNLMTFDTLSSIRNHLSFQKNPIEVVRSKTILGPSEVRDYGSNAAISKEVDYQSNYMNTHENKTLLGSSCNLIFREPFVTSTPLLNSFDNNGLEG